MEIFFSDRDANWTDLRSALTAFRRRDRYQGRITARPLLSACPAKIVAASGKSGGCGMGELQRTEFCYLETEEPGTLLWRGPL